MLWPGILIWCRCLISKVNLLKSAIRHICKGHKHYGLAVKEIRRCGIGSCPPCRLFEGSFRRQPLSMCFSCPTLLCCKAAGKLLKSERGHSPDAGVLIAKSPDEVRQGWFSRCSIGCGQTPYAPVNAATQRSVLDKSILTAGIVAVGNEYPAVFPC